MEYNSGCIRWGSNRNSAKCEMRDRRETEQMKIDLITLHAVKNYGSVLQTLATQKIFESYGYEVEVINYIR